ncbi:MAG: hypothetical protein ACTSSI_00125 [Candidatus Helarchaeota archaeon]
MSEIQITRQLRAHLNKIKRIFGVENVVVSQRDGNPIESVGVWLSKHDIFGLCSSTSAIFNVAEILHGFDLNYILIDGRNSKILIAPIYNKSSHSELSDVPENQPPSRAEFFVSVTTRPKVNLGGIFIKMRQILQDISFSLEKSGQDFKPPLRNFSETEVQDILNSFKVKEELESNQENKSISTFSMRMSSETSEKIRDCVYDFLKNVPGVKIASVALNGGYTLCKFSLDPLIDNQGAMSYSLYDTSRRIIWMLRKTQLNHVLCECKNHAHFIYGIIDGSIFSTYIKKSMDKRLGLLRLIIPQYIQTLQQYMGEAKKEKFSEFDFKELLEELNV